MLTGALRNDIDKLWEKFWTGGITNPLTVIEQISYLMFSRMLDMQEETSERKTARGAQVNLVYPQDKDGQLLRWKNFKNMDGKGLLKHLKDNVYPGFAELKLSGNTDLANFMADADCEIKSPDLLVSAIEMVDNLPLNQSDIKGDIYEYLLSKLTTAGINGQFRTPRHIIDFMIDVMALQPTDTVCDPSCGTAGFLARTMEHLNRKYSSSEEEGGRWQDEEGNWHFSGDLLEPYREHVDKDMFWGFDFDTTMLRVSSMNMLLHGVTNANIHYQDSLNKSWAQGDEYWKAGVRENAFDLVLANPPFKGSLDATSVNKAVTDIVSTKKTELLFVAHILNILKLGGRSATIVPDGVLFGSSKAHQSLRKALLEENTLEGIISLPSGVFKPYAGVSTAILIFTKGGETDNVFFYDVQADGYSLDDKRTPLTGEGSNDLPLALEKWQQYRDQVLALADNEKLTEQFGDRTQPAFIIPASEIADNKYDLSINRYKEVVYEEEQYDPPKEILARLKALEAEIQQDLIELEGML